MKRIKIFKPKQLYLLVVFILMVFLPAIVLAQPVDVSIPDTLVISGDTVLIPIKVSDVTGLEIYSVGTVLSFNSTVLQALDATTATTIAEGWGTPTYDIAAGNMTIGMAGALPLSGVGALLYIKFWVIGSHGDTTTIHFEDFMFNEGIPSATTYDGFLTVTTFVNVWISDTSAEHGDSILIPVMTSTVTNLDIYSVSITLSFANNILEAVDATTDGTIAEGWGAPTHVVTPGEITIGMAGATPLADSGALVYVKFAVTGAMGDTTDIYFSNFVFNEGIPFANTQSGLFTVTGGDSIPPMFSATTIWTDTSFQGPYLISSIITDTLSGVDSAFLYYRFMPDTTWNAVYMQFVASDTYKADIPQVPDTNTIVHYYLQASDFATNTGADPEGAPDSFYSFVGWCTYEPDIDVLPDTLFFSISSSKTSSNVGGVASQDTATMTVYNRGRANLNVSNITTTYSWVIYVNPTSFSVTPSDSQHVTIIVSAAGLSNGTYYGNLNIVSDDPDESPYVEPLKLIINFAGIVELKTEMQPIFVLEQNQPNPFSQLTVIGYEIKVERREKRDEDKKVSRGSRPPSLVSLKIYNLSGKLIRILVDEVQEPGYYKVYWDGKDSMGRKMSSGIYFYKIKVGNFERINKMILIK
ncbi:MAG TPA: hypothetical protein EYP60_09990 [bacterium (Candidatus Stahlbacteria)]|nr:hypothetical protein [Candidatus Stahlbacteria bacterium]